MIYLLENLDKIIDEDRAPIIAPIGIAPYTKLCAQF